MMMGRTRCSSWQQPPLLNCGVTDLIIVDAICDEFF
jgi:hypothetical protein